MTRNFNKHSKSRLLLTLTLIGILCLSLFLFTACGNDDGKSDDKKPNYSYTETTDEIITNSSFVLGTADTALTAFPKTSVSGWTRKTETGMTSSSAKSGVIDVSDKGWDELLNALYNNSYFLNYFKVKYDFTDSDVKDKIREEKGDNNYSPTSTEVKEYIIENYFKSNETFKFPANTTAVNQFQNPGVNPDASDTKLYMLNNYLAKNSVGLGTAQNITSSTTVTLNKGEFGKISVWVKTQNLSGLYNGGTNYGANIRIDNSLNGNSQSAFGIYNITDTEWTKYTIYVKADEVYSSTITLVLGLGSDNLSATEGTVYFDDVNFTHLTAEEFETETANITFNNLGKNLVYECEEDIKILSPDVKDGNNTKPVFYDMTFKTYLDTVTGYVKSLKEQYGLTFDFEPTVSNKSDNSGVITGDRFGSASINDNVSLDSSEFPHASKAVEVTLDKASYTLSLGSNSSLVTLNAKSYAYIECYVKNQLDKLGSTDITVDVFDVYNGQVKKRPAIATISEVSDEWAKLSIMVKNNFDYARSFYLALVFGPTDVVATDYAMDYASGEVLITMPTIAIGSVNQYTDDTNTTKTENYELYSLFNSTVSGSTALYNGSVSDYTEEHEHDESYNFSYAPSDKGTIETAPAIPAGYKGIVANHYYIKEEDTGVEKDINTNPNAGLINTKYLSAYSINGLASALNFTATEDEQSIQPLMIYNDTAKNYGYIGNNKTIAPNSYAKVSVTLRVVDNAKAFIYLVGTDATHKEVLTFADFTDVEGNEYDGESLKLFFEVTSALMNDGWLTVEFYVATGVNAQDFRVEVWNGGRDGSTETASQGFVFIKDISLTVSSAFSEAKFNETWTVSGNPLYEIGKNGFDQLYVHKQSLTENEKNYNAEYPNDKISYSEKYVWAKNDSMIYAVYNSIDPVIVNPFDSIVEEEGTSSGCTANSDPSTFWLSFSSILLGVVLVLAIIMLFIKNIRRRRKANASDAKSHYTVKSRTRNAKPISKKIEKVEDIEEDTSTNEIIEETQDSDEEQVEEQTLDSYVYGEVQDFGEETSETPETDNEGNNE